MTKEEFEEKWHNRLVRYVGDFWKIPQQEYVISAALLSDDEITFAAYRQMGDGWFTIQDKNTPEFLEKLDKSFEVVFSTPKYERPHVFKDGQIFTLNIDMPAYDLKKGFVSDALHENPFSIQGWIKKDSKLWLDQVIEGHVMLRIFKNKEDDPNLCCHMPLGYIDKELTYDREYIDFDNLDENGRYILRKEES